MYVCTCVCIYIYIYIYVYIIYNYTQPRLEDRLLAHVARPVLRVAALRHDADLSQVTGYTQFA